MPTMIVWKKGDRRPSPVITLKLADGTVFDLTGYTAKLIVRADGAATPKINAAVTVLSPATAGKVQYDPAAVDVDTVGVYKGEIEATETATSKTITFPNDGYIPVIVVSDLG
jgi:hypothetical protein